MSTGTETENTVISFSALLLNIQFKSYLTGDIYLFQDEEDDDDDGGSDCAALGACELALSALVLTEAVIRAERTKEIREVPHKNIFRLTSVVLVPEMVRRH